MAAGAPDLRYPDHVGYDLPWITPFCLSFRGAHSRGIFCLCCYQSSDAPMMSLASQTDHIPQLPPLICLPHGCLWRPLTAAVWDARLLGMWSVLALWWAFPLPHFSHGSTKSVEPFPSLVVDPPVPPPFPPLSVALSAPGPKPSPHATKTAWRDVAVAGGRLTSSSTGHWSLVWPPKASPVQSHKGSTAKPQLRYDGDTVCDMEDDDIAVWAAQYQTLDRWKGKENNKAKLKSKWCHSLSSGIAMSSMVCWTNWSCFCLDTTQQPSPCRRCCVMTVPPMLSGGSQVITSLCSRETTPLGVLHCVCTIGWCTPQ